VDVTLASPMLVDESNVFVQCPKRSDSTFFNWNFSALSTNNPEFDVYINASRKSYCGASFNNAMSINQKRMPYIKFDSEINVSSSVFLNVSSSFEDGVRIINLTTKTHSRDSYDHGIYLINDVKNTNISILSLDWDVSYIDLFAIYIFDSSLTSFNISSDVTDVEPYWIYFKKNSRLSFPNHKNPVFFRHASTRKFLYDNRLIALKRNDISSDSSSIPTDDWKDFNLASLLQYSNFYEEFFSSDDDADSKLDANSPGHCFDPCGDCSEGYWGEVHLSKRPCDTRLDRMTCNKTARIYLTQLDAKVTLGCGSPEWDAQINGSCSFVVNDEGIINNLIHPPHWLHVVVAVVISLSAFMTIVGFSSTLGHIVWRRRDVPGLTAWWARSVFRDLLADQFSWAGIVITASLAEVRDYDYTQWGPSVVAIVQMAKHYVLDWFTPCDTCGEPLSFSPPLIVFWTVTILSCIVRVVFIITEKVKVHVNPYVEDALLVFQALFTSAGFILLPLVGYSLAFLGSASRLGFVSLVLALLLFFSQPIGSFTVRCLVGVSSSVGVVLFPVIMALISGLGAPRIALVSLSILSTIILPLMDSVVLRNSFFLKTVYRTSLWEKCFIWTIIIRAASCLCGLVFFIMLCFDLSSVLSIVASCFWFVWILLPWFGLITLILPIPKILSRPGNRLPENNEDVDPDEGLPFISKNATDMNLKDAMPLTRKGVHRQAEISGDSDI